ncbi:MAG: hypothetical protein HYY99_01100, partial [Candidatus Colwellbacteria bacterium]|nr:hypothetical protein [Candidatus Colwellbacteria bacterium]
MAVIYKARGGGYFGSRSYWRRYFSLFSPRSESRVVPWPLASLELSGEGVTLKIIKKSIVISWQDLDSVEYLKFPLWFRFYIFPLLRLPFIRPKTAWGFIRFRHHANEVPPVIIFESYDTENLLKILKEKGILL